MSKIKVNKHVRLSKTKHPDLGDVAILELTESVGDGNILESYDEATTIAKYRISGKTLRKMAKAFKVMADELERVKFDGKSQAW